MKRAREAEATGSTALATRHYKRGRYTARRPYFPRPSVEWKYVDTADAYNVNSTGVLTLINGLSLGNTSTTRIGQKVAIQSLELKYRAAVVATTGLDQTHRILLVLDRQCNGAALTLADVIVPANTEGLRNLASRRRYKILQDIRFDLNAAAESGSSHAGKLYMKFKKPILVEFNAGNAGTVADISSGSIYMIHLGSNAAGITAGTCAAVTRLRYTDI